MRIRVERVTPEEIDEFFELFERVMKTVCGFYSPKVIDYFIRKIYNRESFLLRLKDKLQVVFLARVKSKAVGFLVADRPYGGVAFCRWLGVLEEYQKKGVGRSLMGAWVKWARKNRCHRVVVASVIPAAGFYEKVGLEKEGLTRKGYFGLDQYRLGKIIGEIDEESFI